MFRLRRSTVSPKIPPGLTWLNGPEVSLALLQGSPVLIHFWTYSCIHSLRTLPYLKRWHAIYAPLGLKVVSIHTPEFNFAKDEDSVRQIVAESDINYPVVLDPDYLTWKAFNNTYWPRTLLLSSTGQVIYDHAGEGSYAECELMIQQALLKAGATNLPAIGPDASLGGSHCYRVTPEVSLGYLRGSIGNIRQFTPNGEEAFTDQGAGEEGVPYLHGHFALNNESVEHTRALSGASEYLRLKYRAFGVHAVLQSSGASVEVVVRLDGKPVPGDFLGPDLRIRRVDGETVATVKAARMYHLIKSKVYHVGSLELRVSARGLHIFTITFDGCL